MPFSKFGLHPDLVRAVEAMGYKDSTPIQSKAIPLALEGVDVLGCAQTGSGKTAAFVLPILHHLLTDPRPGLRALVLVPTRELAAQVETACKDIGRFTPIKSAVVIGGVGYHGQRLAIRQGAQVLVATPGRLLDHLDQGTFHLNNVEFLVLDEADRMFDMGFLPEIREILNRVPPDRQTMLFSATLVPEVERIAAFALKEPQRVEISSPKSTAEGISQILYPVMESQKTEFLLALLRETEMHSVLVFSRTKRGADRLMARLKGAGFSVGVLHSDRTQIQREEAMEAFRKQRIQILVATDLAARGLDVKGISHVINFNVPDAPADYVHRVGRTARAYGVGDAITLMDRSEQPSVTAIERHIGLVFPRAMLPNFPYVIPPVLRPPEYKNPWQRNWGRRRMTRYRQRRR